MPVSKALDLFISKKDHMFLVRDSYYQPEVILTLEYCVETILGKGTKVGTRRLDINTYTINDENSIITEENGYVDIIMTNSNPMDYINKILYGTTEMMLYP